MTDKSRSTADGVRWTGRLAILGFAIAAVTAIAATLGRTLPDPIYWLGIVLSIGGILGATAVIARSSHIGYGAGVISAMAGVLVIGYGFESEILLVTIVGGILVLAGATGIVVDTRRTTS